MPEFQNQWNYEYDLLHWKNGFISKLLKFKRFNLFSGRPMNKTIRIFAFIGFALILIGMAGACKTKQNNGYLDLHTRILIHESDVGAGKNLKISVVDSRRKNILIRKDTDRKIKTGRALVSKDYHPSLALDTNFKNTALEAFQMQGYETQGKGVGSERELTIYITKLDLRIRKHRNKESGESQVQARLRSKMKIQASNQGRSLRKEYEFFIKKDYPMAPAKIENEKILNYGLTQLLYQIVEDPRLNDFLTG